MVTLLKVSLPRPILEDKTKIFGMIVH